MLIFKMEITSKKRRIESDFSFTLSHLMEFINNYRNKAEMIKKWNECLHCVQDFKKLIVSDEIALRLVSKEQRPVLSRLIQFLSECWSVITINIESKSIEINNVLGWIQVLRQMFSLIANSCHLSLDFCINMTKMTSYGQLLRLIGKILSDKADYMNETQATVLRLLSNLCEHKESAVTVVHNAQVLKLVILKCSTSVSSVRKYALRTVRFLLTYNVSFSKALLKKECAHYLGLILRNSAELNELREDTGLAIELLLKLTKSSPTEVGQQLVNSKSAYVLFTLVTTNNIAQRSEDGWKLLRQLCEHSLEFRENLESDGAIGYLTALNEECLMDSHIQCLCCFAQDAFGRESLRQSGALDILVERLKSHSERRLILQTLNLFIYDQQGLHYLYRHTDLLQIFLAHMNTFIDRYARHCDEQFSVVPDHRPAKPDCYRPDSPSLIEIKKRQERMEKENDESDCVGPLCKDFSGYSDQQLPCGSGHHLWSPSMSPTVAASASPTNSSLSNESDSCSLAFAHYRIAPSLAAGSYLNDSFLNEISGDISDLPNSDTNEKLIMKLEIFLMSWISHQDMLSILIREDLIEQLVRYMALIDDPDPKVARILVRVARSRQFVESLLAMQFHFKVILALCRSPCYLSKNLTQCNRCSHIHQFGMRLLSDFSCQVDSDFGLGVLINSISRNGDSEVKLRALMAGSLLVRSTAHRKRFVLLQNVVPKLMREFELLMSKWRNEKSETIGQILIKILIAVSFWAVSNEKMDAILRVDDGKRDDCLCQVDDTLEESESDILTFELASGNLFKVDKSRVEARSDYFKRMLDSSFAEGLTGQRRFEFESMTGSEEQQLINWLHLVSGCPVSAPCLRSISTDSFLSMIVLSDRYLVDFSPLFNHVKRCLNGHNFDVFLSTALSIAPSPTFLDICFAAMFRFATENQLLRALSVVCQQPTLIQTFIDHLITFLT